MGPDNAEEMLLNLTRLGAKEAYLLCDRAFAGADTLATAYTLSLAVKRLLPDLVICGRQTIDGDTVQTGSSLSVAAGLSLITNVMKIKDTAGQLVCETRDMGEQTATYPALIAVERMNHLRLPSIRSQGALQKVSVKTGMKQSATVIAVNQDRKAPIFDYADYGIVATAEELVEYFKSELYEN